MGGLPPHDIGAEQVVLGALLSGVPVAAAGLEPLDFYRPAHQLIYEAICALDSAGSPRDPVAVSDELLRRGQPGRMGGAPYLHTCMAACPAPAMTGYYARIVLGHAVRRVVIENATRIIQAACDLGADVDAVVLAAWSEITRALARVCPDRQDGSP